jgi:hypothetical protein
MNALQDWFDTQAFYALLVLVLLCLPLAMRIGRGGRSRGAAPPPPRLKRRTFWHRR